MKPPFILCQWDGEHFVPHARASNVVAAHFVVGEFYEITEVQERSSASHRHYFASLAEAFSNLPESISRDFDNVEHFRARGLVECGFHDEFRFVCESPVEAVNAVAAFIRGNPNAVIAINGKAAVVRIAKSQSARAMDKATFQASKQAVLEWAWALCGISPDMIGKNAGNAA